MKFFRTITLTTLLLILALSMFSEYQAKPGIKSKKDEVSWVTQQVNAPRVSFHTFRSQAAKSLVSYHVYKPAAYKESDVKRFPVLYWLHGTEGGVNHILPVSQMFDHAIRNKVVPPMIVVFVNGLSKRLWTNSKDGLAPIETVFIDELIPNVEMTMRTIATREGRILEGFSMGGYGAARIGFKHAGLFGGVSILAAGPLDLNFEGPRATGNPLREQILNDVCNGDIAYFKSTHPWTVAESQARFLKKSGIIIRQAVGSEDFTLNLNRRFHEHLLSLDIPHEFHIVDGVGHNTPALMAGLANSEFYRNALMPRSVKSIAKKPHDLE
jgi:enterochelin esterase-like enzyme